MASAPLPKVDWSQFNRFLNEPSTLLSGKLALKLVVPAISVALLPFQWGPIGLLGLLVGGAVNLQAGKAARRLEDRLQQQQAQGVTFTSRTSMRTHRMSQENLTNLFGKAGTLDVQSTQRPSMSKLQYLFCNLNLTTKEALNALPFNAGVLEGLRHVVVAVPLSPVGLGWVQKLPKVGKAMYSGLQRYQAFRQQVLTTAPNTPDMERLLKRGLYKGVLRLSEKEGLGAILKEMLDTSYPGPKSLLEATEATHYGQYLKQLMRNYTNYAKASWSAIVTDRSLSAVGNRLPRPFNYLFKGMAHTVSWLVQLLSKAW